MPVLSLAVCLIYCHTPRILFLPLLPDIEDDGEELELNRLAVLQTRYRMSLLMRIVTYNLRYDSNPDDIPVQESLDVLQDPLQEPQFLQLQGEQLWSTRRIRVAEQVVGEGAVMAGWRSYAPGNVHIS